MSVIDRLSAGEDYYTVFGSELRRDDYPAKSVFNWRTPLHYSLVAWLSVPRATALLKLLVLASVLATAGVLARSGTAAAITGTGAQMGALATAFQPDAVGVAEIWAGVFIALSSCAYYREQWIPGALLAAGALFMRELAAPYCLACALLALAARRRETAVWIAAGVAYAAYYALHAWQVSVHQLPGDLAHVQPWQQWNGLGFNLATVGVNGWLGFLPGWMAVLYLVSALAGTFSRGIVAQVKAGLLTYFLLFAVIGLPFNYYWGFVTAPLWAFGLAHAVDGLRRLIAGSKAQRGNGGLAEARPGS
jgi:hypothetical protein